MQVKLGDLVLVENPFKIPGNYIVTHIGKDNLHFRGVLVVWKPKENQPVDKTALLPNGAYAILTFCYGSLEMKKVQRIVESVGADIGLEIEQKWKSNRRACRKSNKKNLCSSLPDVPKRVLPKRITKVYRGGTCSHK